MSMIRKCGCTWLSACNKHSKEMDEIDMEIDNRYIERINRKAENGGNAAEDKLSVAADFLLLLVMIAFVIWAACGVID